MFHYIEGCTPFYRSDMLTSRHGFSTRQGGVSILPHTASLNLGFGRGDSDGTVRENLRRFVSAAAGDGMQYVTMSQLHSTTVKYVVAGESGIECDGVVTDAPSLALIARSADCVPVLLEYRADDRAIVAAVHSGWRGTAADMMAAAVLAMVKLGARPDKISAAIGPCIHRCCFEVGRDVKAAFEAAGMGDFIEPSRGSADKFYADLPGACRFSLMRAGVLPGRVDTLDKCTMCEPDAFYSHRATGGKRGTLGAVIAI